MQLRFTALAIALACASCYSYAVAPCTVRCALSHECPPSFACMDDNFCHASADEAMCPCIPLRCEEIEGSCGDMPDTCGGTVHCGGCTDPLTCGGGGTPNVCGDPGHCVPQACQPGQCGPITDSCGNPTTCPNCPSGMKCNAGKCEACTPMCPTGELKCGDDSCGGSCGSCPDARWTCHLPEHLCCIKENQQCEPLTEGCNCCPGLFCESGFCVPAAGCALAPELTPLP